MYLQECSEALLIVPCAIHPTDLAGQLLRGEGGSAAAFCFWLSSTVHLLLLLGVCFAHGYLALTGTMHDSPELPGRDEPAQKH